MTKPSASQGAEYSPDFATFETLYNDGKAQVLATRLVADLETPVSAFLKLTDRHGDNSFLFESVEGGAVRGRYSVIGLRPDVIWRCNGDKAEINRHVVDGGTEFEPVDEPSLDAIRTLLTQSQLELDESLPPMSAGIFGYMSYDTVRLMEELNTSKPDPLQAPDAIFIRPTLMVIFDAIKDELTMVRRTEPCEGVSAAEAYEQAVIDLNTATVDLNAPVPHQAHSSVLDEKFEEPSSNTSKSKYLKMVRAAQEYIKAGDIFQVVLSQRFSAPFKLPPFSLYRALRRTNPSPFLYFLNFADFSIIGSSPEILVRARDNKVTVRPIAGTRPRGTTQIEDMAFSKELLEDPKECAEHLMLLDLGRNDVGRVCELGTVSVTDQFFIEYYSHVMHIVSNVEGELSPQCDEIDALMAGFPAGTVSGAPKVRAMEIIDELEADKRGIYAGCVGYFSANGEMDSCIVLRTAVVKDEMMYVQAGAGIVADSKPLSEHKECVNKAKALFKAREEAVRFASQKSNL